MRLILRLAAAAVILYVLAFAFRIYVRKYYVFLPDYGRWELSDRRANVHSVTHVFFLFTDHFEPDYDAQRVARWAARYGAMAAKHRDSDGRLPQHTFFYPGEQVTSDIFDQFRLMVEAGYGEVELHYHHDFDTAETLRPQLARAISAFQRYGFLKTVDGRTCFAFIHGNWGLDNANGPIKCGVNDELRLLRELGCFADFTFPSIYEDAQPPFVNTIYAAKDDDQPRSYAKRLPLSALADGGADLMIFEGPLIFSPSLRPTHLFVDLDDGDIHKVAPAAARVDAWVRANVHVPNRPDWVFIKVHGHGISSPDDVEAALGDDFDAALSRLESRYNDGRRYRLHYINAREAYNLALAAAKGLTGEPEEYYDVPIPPYATHAQRGTTPFVAGKNVVTTPD